MTRRVWSGRPGARGDQPVAPRRMGMPAGDRRQHRRGVPALHGAGAQASGEVIRDARSPLGVRRGHPCVAGARSLARRRTARERRERSRGARWSVARRRRVDETADERGHPDCGVALARRGLTVAERGIRQARGARRCQRGEVGLGPRKMLICDLLSPILARQSVRAARIVKAEHHYSVA